MVEVEYVIVCFGGGFGEFGWMIGLVEGGIVVVRVVVFDDYF